MDQPGLVQQCINTTMHLLPNSCLYWQKSEEKWKFLNIDHIDDMSIAIYQHMLINEARLYQHMSVALGFIYQHPDDLKNSVFW